MPKAEVGSAKYVANKAKSKGLQKLKFFCQMCQKQCRDDNGFKCHIMSESHQRQMELFTENTEEYLDSFSLEFQKDFMILLKRRFGVRRVLANVVYNEFIGDKLHTHMNSTTWETLTEFIMHLGKEGLCVVDETPKGWYITYIDRDPQTLARQEAIAKKERMALTDDERAQKLVDEQMARALSKGAIAKESEFTELQRSEDGPKVTLSLAAANGASGVASKAKPSIFAAASKKESTGAADKAREREDRKRKPMSNLERIMAIETEKKAKILRQQEEREKLEKTQAQDKKHQRWICKRLIVKIVNKKLASGRYHKCKGEIVRVIDSYIAEVEMLDSGDVLKLDQAHLETVIPKIGGPVMCVGGQYKGEIGGLEALDTANFSASIRLKHNAQIVTNVAYEDFCKIV